MNNDLNIVNGTLVFPEGCRKGCIGIRDGKITDICGSEDGLAKAAERIDAEGLLLFPGMIDSHVHIRGGAFSYREDFTSGSAAAVSSGITTILEMPGCAKPASTLEKFLARMEEVKRDGAISFGLYGAAGADNLDEIPKIAKAGAVGFKTFQMAPVAGREPEFYGMCSETKDDLVRVMKCVRETGLSLTVHCESQAVVDEMQKKVRAENRCDVIAFSDSRPVEAELQSVRLVLEAAAETGCRTVIAHVSAPETIELVTRAKAEGVPVIAESCAHYLCFDRNQMNSYGVFARMKPPFRDRERVDRLAEYYRDGFIDITGSDHAPYTREEKLRNGNDIWNTYDGLPGLELTLPLLLKLTEEGKLSYERIAASFSESTAGHFRLKQKGRLEPGRDADIVFVKKLPFKVKIGCDHLFCKCRDTALIYNDIPVNHQILKTMYRGRIVYSEGGVSLSPGTAEIVRPQ